MSIFVCEGTNFKVFFEEGKLTICRYLTNGNYESKSVVAAQEFIAAATSFLQKLPIPKVRGLRLELAFLGNLHMVKDKVFYAFSPVGALLLLERILEDKIRYEI